MSLRFWQIIIGMLIFSGLAAGFWFWQNSRTSLQPVIAQPKIVPHLAGDSSERLTKIKIKAVYFVPQQAVPESTADFTSQLTEGLTQTAAFYKLQMNNSVDITWEIYPQAVVGEASSTFYDGNDTSSGNPHALLSVQQELWRRFAQPDEDLSTTNFLNSQSGEYEVLAIFYEGLGATGTVITPQLPENKNGLGVVLKDGQPPAFLVSRYFFTAPSYQDYRTSIFAHEFGHTIGLKDDYNLITGQPLSDDIMGSGRFRPLVYNYLSLENKKLLGIRY